VIGIILSVVLALLLPNMQRWILWIEKRYNLIDDSDEEK
jgi:hypothetical protein